MADHIYIDPGTGGSKTPIELDTLPDGDRAQVVKLRLGSEGLNGGLVGANNPLPIRPQAMGIVQSFSQLQTDTPGDYSVSAGTKLVVLSSLPSNTHLLYLAADSSPGVGNFILAPGQIITLPLVGPTEIWAVADDAAGAMLSLLGLG